MATVDEVDAVEDDYDSRSLLDEAPTLDELVKYIDIGCHWELLGTLLRLNPKKLKSIAAMSCDDELKTLKMFQLWLKDQPDATRQQVIDCLAILGENKIRYDYEMAVLKGSIHLPVPLSGLDHTEPKITYYKHFFLFRIALVMALCGFLIPYLYRPSVLDQYAYCLQKNVYADIQPTGPNEKAPFSSERVEFVALAAVKLKGCTIADANSFTRLTLLQGGVDEIRKVKEPLEMRDILKPVSEKHLKLVLIEGAPGIGKTTLVEELVKRWSNHGFERDTSICRWQRRTVDYLEKYSLLIRIPLREKKFQEAKQFDDLFIEEPRTCGSVNMTELKQFINSTSGDGVLWILDGYDELPHWQREVGSFYYRFITEKPLRLATIVVTSRPTASGNLLDYINDIDSKRIEVIGFNETAIDKYARSFFSKSEEKYTSFTQYYKNNSIIENMMYVPLNCKILCLIYDDFYAKHEKPIPSTLTGIYNALVIGLIRRHLVFNNPVLRNLTFPDRLITEEDFEKSSLPNESYKEAYRSFLWLTEHAYNGVITQNYIFNETDRHLYSLGLMNTIVSSSHAGPQYTSRFMHTTLQEYLAAVYIVSNQLAEQTFSHDKIINVNPNLAVVLTFYAGIIEMLQLEFDSYSLSVIQSFQKSRTVCMYSVRCLYESPKLFESFHTESGPVQVCDGIMSFTAPYDYYVTGYLISRYNISVKLSVLLDVYLDFLIRGIRFDPNPQGIVNHLAYSIKNERIDLLFSIPKEVLRGLSLYECFNFSFINMIGSLSSLESLSYPCLSCHESCHYLSRLKNLQLLYTTLKNFTHDEMMAFDMLILPGNSLSTLDITLHFFDRCLSTLFLFRHSSLEELRVSCYDASSVTTTVCPEINAMSISSMSSNSNLVYLEIDLHCPHIETTLPALANTQLRSIVVYDDRSNDIHDATFLIDLIKFSSTLQNVTLKFKFEISQVMDIAVAAQSNPVVKSVKLRKDTIGYNDTVYLSVKQCTDKIDFFR